MGSEFRWIIGSIAVVIVFGLGLLVYGIIDSNRSISRSKATIDAGEGAAIKIDRWECMKGQDQRGAPYEYSRNARNGATGPASIACKKED
jgi:hypothetical protein